VIRRGVTRNNSNLAAISPEGIRHFRRASDWRSNSRILSSRNPREWFEVEHVSSNELRTIRWQHFSYFDAGEPDHEAVSRVIDGSEGLLVVSPYVIAELDYLVATRVGVDASLRMFSRCRPSWATTSSAT